MQTFANVCRVEFAELSFNDSSSVSLAGRSKAGSSAPAKLPVPKPSWKGNTAI